MAAPLRTHSKIKQGKFKIATWNIQGGIQSQYDAETLCQDFESYKIDIGILQETKCGEFGYTSVAGTQLMCLESDETTPPNRRYGQGFVISKRWSTHFWGIKRISDRISVAQFRLNKTGTRKSKMCIINVYGPTSMRQAEHPEETEQYYDTLKRTVEAYKKVNYVVIVAGDFNAKLGLKQEGETIMGRYGKGTRNASGHLLANFLTSQQLYATNTTFDKAMRFRTTWSAVIQQKQIYNQIDYICVNATLITKHPHFLTDAQSHNGMTFSSDHKMVISTLDLSALYKLTRQMVTNKDTSENKNRQSYDPTPLIREDDTRNTYCNHLTQILQAENMDDKTPQEQYEIIQDAIYKAVDHIALEQKRPLWTTHKPNYFEDRLLKDWTKTIKNISKRIDESRSKKRKSKLRRERSQLKYQIRKRIRELQQLRVDEITKILETNKGNTRAFEAQRLLRKTCRKPFQIQDQEGHLSSNPQQAIPLLTEFYKNFFNQEGQENIEPFQGELPSPLEEPITIEETKEAMEKLVNGRAAGGDFMIGELLKYGAESLAPAMTKMYNDIFQQNSSIKALLSFIIIPLNKPGKAPTANNTRPISLANMIRKVLSNITLKRLTKYLDSFVSLNQRAYQKDRSTADILWSYRWLNATVQKYQQVYEIMGIDLSKAFDCIDRTKLLDVIRPHIDKSLFRLINYLLSDTTFTIRVSGQMGKITSSTIGTPQGDALSPILFIIYLDAALQEFWTEIGYPDTPDYLYCMYADDTDFISSLYADHFITQLSLPEVLKRYNLKVNLEKTEFTRLHKETVHENDTKKLGSKLSDNQEVNWRISKAIDAYRQMNKLWLNKTQVSTESKIRMYSACIKPILTYLTSTISTTQSQMEKLNTTHRKHLRHLMNIFYPKKITNSELYRKTKQRTITLDIVHSRWKLFGHILRQHPDTITNVVMDQYFTKLTPRHHTSGKLPTSLPVQLHLDIVSIQQGLKLKNSKDLQHLRNLAQDKSTWRQLTDLVVKAAKAKEERRYMEQQKRRERTRITYESNGVTRNYVFILRRPNSDPPLNNTEPTRRRIRLTLSPLPPDDIQQRRALTNGEVDIHNHRFT